MYQISLLQLKDLNLKQETKKKQNGERKTLSSLPTSGKHNSKSKKKQKANEKLYQIAASGKLSEAVARSKKQTQCTDSFLKPEEMQKLRKSIKIHPLVKQLNFL